MKSARIFAILALLVPVFLAGCGFQLRGKTHVSPLLSVVYIQNQLEDVNLSRAVDQIMGELGYSSVVKSQSKLILLLESSRYNKRVLSIGSLGKAQEFEVTYTVHYSLRHINSEQYLVQEVLSLKRDMSYDVSAALGKSKEEQIIKQELLLQAARAIVRRIQYLKVEANLALLEH